MKTSVADVVMKMKFSINKYSQVFNRVGPGYGEFIKFIIIDKYVAFPQEEYNFSFTDVEFQTAVHQHFTELMSGCSKLQSSCIRWLGSFWYRQQIVDT
jgi:hypothetical protein